MLLVENYKIFTNDDGAVIFRFKKQDILDNNNPEGPFVFTVHESNLFAGTKDYYVAFPNVPDDMIEQARNRGNIALMEVNDEDEPQRATPCYFVEGF